MLELVSIDEQAIGVLVVAVNAVIGFIVRLSSRQPTGRRQNNRSTDPAGG